MDAAAARGHGTYVCFAVTLKGFDTAIGIFQMRETEPGFGTAEWGFAVGSEFWGTGVFQAGAELVLEFAFNTLGAHRLEARAAVKNGRGNGALRKMGAVQEGVLRKSFQKNGEYLDQVLYAIVEDDYRATQNISWPKHPLVHQDRGNTPHPAEASHQTCEGRPLCRRFFYFRTATAAPSMQRRSVPPSSASSFAL